MFVLGYTGCDPAAPAALYCAALMLTGATPAGVYSSAADIAPNYAGKIFFSLSAIYNYHEFPNIESRSVLFY